MKGRNRSMAPANEALRSAFRDLMRRGDLPNDDITMDGIYGVRTLSPVRLERDLLLDRALVELREIVKSERQRDDSGDA
jgi:hypothetical protein